MQSTTFLWTIALIALIERSVSEMIGSILGIPIEQGVETKIILNSECYWAVQSMSCRIPDSLAVFPVDEATNKFTKDVVEAINDLRLAFFKKGCEL
jgi:hypothetical protein